MENIWGIVLVAGPFVLGFALLWATFRKRGASSTVHEAEEATRRMYFERDSDDRPSMH